VPRRDFSDAPNRTHARDAVVRASAPTGSVGFARGFGLSTFLVSVIFLGFDPENLAVGAVGSVEDAGGIALGTILGSAMVAVALALGIAGVLAPMRFEQVPRHVLAVPIAAVLLLGAFALDGVLSRVDGAILVAGYAAAVDYLIRLSRRGVTIEASGEVTKEMGKAERLGKASPRYSSWCPSAW
jgi:cation:H+ antiporter